MSRPQTFTLSLVVPAYNEAANVLPLVDRLVAQTRAFPAVEILIVDDGSSDDTLERLRLAAVRHPALRYVSLSRNFGHQAALRAGLAAARGDCVICMDADLQHPPELVPELVRRWQAGADIVNCIRQDQASLPLFKRLTSRWFYRGLSWLSGLELVPGSSDFRLLDRKALDALLRLSDTEPFLRGAVQWLGFRTTTVPFRVAPRRAGASKYGWRRMFGLATGAILSYSTRLLHLGIWIGLATSLVAFVELIVALIDYTSGQVVPS